MTAQTVLVTGGAGFVGSYVVRDLLRAGARPVVFDSVIGLSTLASVVPAEDRAGLMMEQGDVTDEWKLLRLCQRHEVERIVHLASPLTRSVRESPKAGLAAMCGGTANVFEVVRALGLGRVVWASSIAVFGSAAGPVAPDSARRPSSLYGSGKALCEDLAAAYRDDHGVDSIGLRLAVLYGPWRLRGWEASFGQESDPIQTAVAGRPIVVREPELRLNWLYVEDASGLICRALTAATPAEHVFNTSGEAATRLEFSARIAELVPGAEITVEPDLNRPPGAVPDRSGEFDDGPLREQIGYATHHDLREGIGKTVAEYRRVEGSERPSEP
jgi:UDP-glucose 4-epimerase